MYTRQRDGILCVPREGYHRVPMAIIIRTECGRQCLLDDDHVPILIEMIDRDGAD